MSRRVNLSQTALIKLLKCAVPVESCAYSNRLGQLGAELCFVVFRLGSVKACRRNEASAGNRSHSPFPM